MRRSSGASAVASVERAEHWFVSQFRAPPIKLYFPDGVEELEGMDAALHAFSMGNQSDDVSVSATRFRVQQKTESDLKDLAESGQALRGAAAEAKKAIDAYDRALKDVLGGGGSVLQESSARRRKILVEIVAKIHELDAQTPKPRRRARGARIEAIARRAHARGVIAAVRRMGVQVSPKSVAIAAVALQVDPPLHRDESFDVRCKKWGALIRAVERTPPVVGVAARRI